MTALGAGIAEAFRVAALELGHGSASWLFVREVAAAGGDTLVAELRDLLGREYPTLDAVAGAWHDGVRAPVVDPAPVLAACDGSTSLLVIGIEALYLDELLPRLPAHTRVSLLVHGDEDTNWDRITSNYERLEAVDLTSFQRVAGRRSTLLTFLYGIRGDRTWVEPAWMRVMGADVRMQFRTIIGWDVLGATSFLYPRWKTETSLADFSHVVRA